MAPPRGQVPLTKVTVTGHQCAFPPTCACCGAAAEGEEEISRTRTTPLVVASPRKTMTLAVPETSTLAAEL
jgi:hypothetical protein